MAGSIGPIRVLGFAGSLRQGSYNRAVLRAAVPLMPAGGVLETFDLAGIPLYNGDPEAEGGSPGGAGFQSGHPRRRCPAHRHARVQLRHSWGV